MAAGNQLEKGICALLVIAATIIEITWNLSIGDSHILVISQCP